MAVGQYMDRPPLGELSIYTSFPETNISLCFILLYTLGKGRNRHRVLKMCPLNEKREKDCLIIYSIEVGNCPCDQSVHISPHL